VKRFALLYERLDSTTSTRDKVAAIEQYVREAPPADVAWALFFLTGRRLKRLVPTPELWAWILEVTGLPPWLLEESQAVVGDLAETIALVLDGVETSGKFADLSLSRWIEERIAPLRDCTAEERRERVLGYWSELRGRELFLLNKLLTGAFRVGVSATLVERAVAAAASVPQAVITHRMMGAWEPTAAFVASLLSPEGQSADPAHPYPFFLAHPLEGSPSELGDVGDYQIEWKWDGIRAQIVRRAGEVFLFSRGEELITERFPEVVSAARELPDGTVIDGEILAFRGEMPLPFAALQKRIGRLKLSPKVLAESPAMFMAYDLLEQGGNDVRELPLTDRRARLELLLAGKSGFRLSPRVEGATWEDIVRARDTARERAVEGLMLKRRAAAYGVGRHRGDWWKWKVDPFTVDAVLIYAHPGNGRRANLLTDYTFGIWREQELVPFAKAYSGLSDAEILEVDRWIRQHTRERAGPTRIVEPSQVFELAFEGIALSSRHKSGVAVRFPRILRWRKDKPATEADTLETVRALLRAESDGGTG
jgi:DNA ligase 1